MFRRAAVTIAVLLTTAGLGATAVAFADDASGSTTTTEGSITIPTANTGTPTSVGTVSTQATATPDDIDICTAGTGFSRGSGHDMLGFGYIISCSERTEVLSPTVTLWEKNAAGQELNIGQKTYGSGVAPYSTFPSLDANCTVGLNVHVEFKGTFSASAGVGTFLRNSDPLVCK
jgi:hypothetical protein